MLNQKAEQVCEILCEKHPRLSGPIRFYQNGSYQFDPMLILIVISIIYNLIKLYIICGYSYRKAIDKAMNPGIIGRLHMGNVLKKELRRENGKYAHLYHPLKEALQESAKSYTEEEMEYLYKVCGEHEQKEA